MTELERSMESLITVFHHYAAADGAQGTLSKKGFKNLMEKELPSFLAGQKNRSIVDKMMKDLDQNDDQQLDFLEFMSLIAGLTVTCEEKFSKGKGKKM